ncbi:transporter [Marinobacter lacisalsi]|uniref:Transporter n=1 Tax=Marinobacter lacisalsi TaxID=475979 RepID=A0ABV8QEE2_9GAMM
MNNNTNFPLQSPSSSSEFSDTNSMPTDKSYFRIKIMLRRTFWAITGLAMLCFTHTSYAAESVVSANPTGGTDVSAAIVPPKSGAYGAITTIPMLYSSGYRDSDGNKVEGPNKIYSALGGLSLLYVYDYKPLGGTLSSSFSAFYQYADTTLFGRSESITGFVDPYLDLFYYSKHVGLAGAEPGSKMLPYGLTLAFGTGARLPWGRYDTDNLLNPGVNYYLLSPNAAFTYMTGPNLSFGDSTEISARAFYGIPFRNDDTDYKSGDTLSVDFAVAQHFGEFSVGLAGNRTVQVEDDDPGESGVPVVDGKKTSQWALGPVVTYRPSGSDLYLKAKYLRYFKSRNNLDSNALLFSVAFPL